MPVNKETGEIEPGDFAAFLATVRPRTNVELAEALAGVVTAVQDTGKAGSVTLTITVKPLADDAQIIQVFDQIKTNRPEHDRKGSLAYPDGEGNLSRTDPNSLPLWEDTPRTAPAAADPTDVKEPPAS